MLKFTLLSKIDIFVKIRLFNEKNIFITGKGAHFKEDGTLNLNQYKLSILLRQFYFIRLQIWHKVQN